MLIGRGKIMTNIEMKEVSKVAEEFYKANRQDFIADLSTHIEKRIKSGLAQFKNGQYMSIEDSKQQLKNELFSSNS